MRFDSYTTPDAQSQLRKARVRWAEDRQQRRVFLTEAAAATAFLAAAVAIDLLAPWSRPLHLTSLGAAIAAYLIAARVTFPVGPVWTRPTQVAFVPMLFVLPVPVVPLVVALCLVLDTWPYALRRELSATRILARIGDSFYALGPVLVLLAAHAESFAWRRWPVLLLAFAAQVLFDGLGFARTWLAERIPPSAQLDTVWIYLTDASLSCVGLLVAASAVRRPGLILLSLPLLALLGLFARERQQRMDNTLALSTAYRGTTLLLGDVIEADDEYTGMHSRAVVDAAIAVCERLGLDATRRQRVEFGALLHDVGKIRVPKEIIQKPGKLDDAEWEIMCQHTVYGEAMLKQVGGVLASVGSIVRSSHELYDGTGYPDGLAGEEIPIEARIISACDAYNAMTTDRPYRSAMSTADAIAELRRCSGSQFDPVVVRALESELPA
jgi:HD-GYP domain-containing protein (c-di-GMP phosphodiesterase class II)